MDGGVFCKQPLVKTIYKYIACSSGVFCGARVLNNPSFASYGRHLGWKNAQRAEASQKGPQGRG